MTECNYPKQSEENDAAEKKKWFHRRMMAYISLITLIFLMLSVVFWVPLDRMASISDFVGYAFLSLASLTGAYLGLATWASKK